MRSYFKRPKHLPWTIWNGDPMQEVSYTADTSRLGNSKNKRARYQNNSKRVLRNMEEKNMGTKKNVPNKT